MQDGGHQDPGDGLVEDGVTNSHDVHHRGGAEDGQHVGRHALPEVQQEALDLQTPHRKLCQRHRGGRGKFFIYLFKATYSFKREKPCLVKVGSDHRVQYPLTVRSVHHDEGRHLKATTQY